MLLIDGNIRKMHPRGFVRVLVGALGLRVPVASKPSGTRLHTLSSPCYCEIRLPNLPIETAPVPMISDTYPAPETRNIAAGFYLDEHGLQKLRSSSCYSFNSSCLEISVHTAHHGSSCAFSEGKLLGTLKIPLSMEWTEGVSVQIHSGWSSIRKDKSQGRFPGAELHVNVKVEADPRFFFQFDGETALGPQITQVQGNMRQPIFSCKFSRDRSFRKRLGQPDTQYRANGWRASLQSDKDKERKERKGWIVVVHDLSGSPVAAASMVTPFVPFTGSDHVSRSNPGAWLILRPEPRGASNWLPWGRLEAWRERSGKGKLGLRFQLIPDSGVAGTGNGVLVSETIIPMQKGGEFVVDIGRLKTEVSPLLSPVAVGTPQSCGDCSFALGLSTTTSGFVMSCKVPGERKCSKPTVQLATRHVACVEDAAVFMALAAAVDLSRDACQPFSRKLRRELSQPLEDPF